MICYSALSRGVDALQISIIIIITSEITDNGETQHRPLQQLHVLIAPSPGRQTRLALAASAACCQARTQVLRVKNCQSVNMINKATAIQARPDTAPVGACANVYYYSSQGKIESCRGCLLYTSDAADER